MGRAFAGMVGAPMTSVVMIFEITRDYAVNVTLMISNLVSFFIPARFQKEPIYEVLAQQDGIHLPSVETRQQLEQRQVVHAMREATEVLRAEMTVQEAQEKLNSSQLRALPVCNERGVIGVVRLQDLTGGTNDDFGGKRLRELLGEDEFPHVPGDPQLYLVPDCLGVRQLEFSSGENRAEVHQL